MSKTKSKYFVVGDAKLAVLMSMILNQKYYVYDDDKKQGQKIFTFLRTEDTIAAYAKAKVMLEIK